jgi:hypothetical protein
MYSFSPVIDMSNIHFGFWCLLLIACIFIVLGLIVEDLGWRGKSILMLAFSSLAFLGHAWSYNDHPPQNIPVTATFVQFETEGYSSQMGKSTTDHHNVYVVYKLESGEFVILHAGAGYTYSPVVTLYKNVSN